MECLKLIFPNYFTLSEGTTFLQGSFNFSDLKYLLLEKESMIWTLDVITGKYKNVYVLKIIVSMVLVVITDICILRKIKKFTNFIE